MTLDELLAYKFKLEQDIKTYDVKQNAYKLARLVAQ